MKQKVLLLSCCAPCFCTVVEQLVSSEQDVTVIFYNPNIRPFDEYQKRMVEQKDVCAKYKIPFIELEYDNERWCALTKGLENEPERGARCSVCFYMRLKRTMEYAQENGFDAVASILGVSRYKDNDQVRKEALKASLEVGVPYIEIEYRTDGAYDLAKELNLYRQRYCGCKPRQF